MTDAAVASSIERIALPNTVKNGSSWSVYRVLAGFMDMTHFFQVGGEALNLLQGSEKAKAETAHQRAASRMRTLDPLNLGDVVVGEIPGEFGPYLESVRSAPAFQQVYGRRPVTFGLVDASRLCVVQPLVKTDYHAGPADTSMKSLLEFCLPVNFEAHIEYTVVPQQNGFQIIATAGSSNFDFEGVGVATDGALLRFTPNKNWVQAVRVNDRYFVKNGYHRIFHLLGRGITQVPALVTDAVNPQELGCNNAGFFGLDYVMGLPRPPVMSDFLGPVAIELGIRERRRVIQIRAVVDKFGIPE